ncbi:uncharacterized protein B0J16DRAFT_400197 [Fusarium flagelliforme]|uniref:uncharacterized protein n=1 Tax=Fusarium flagelliforme TaxID=2675880 RepID=UPI001E8CB90D|nr:uncharacterized protein B0J16DRAFT_400197 [Fusarium flagelliforme]KAH7186197.1 hypothetical protein B0J16DRAFT_400197 [Fusarium flagelliforme]
MSSQQGLANGRPIAGTKIISFLLKLNADEKPKVLIKNSRWIALARCAVHVVPALLTIGLSALNFVGFFVGGELHGAQNDDESKLGALQVATKVQELLIVASLSTVIFHALRSEIIFGPGLPLGLLVSGFSFSSISYVFSPEFLGGVWRSWKQMSNSPNDLSTKARRYGLIVLLLVGSLLALVAAPATAVLMIPRVKDWEVGGGVHWLIGNDEYLWPTNLTASYYQDINCTEGADPFVNPRCPSTGFKTLFSHFENLWRLHGDHFNNDLRDPFIRKALYSKPALHRDADTWAFTTHHATAVLLDAVRGLHLKALVYLYNFHPLLNPWPQYLILASRQRYEVETMAPAARVLCNPHSIMDLEGGNITVGFPHFDLISSYIKTNSTIDGGPFPALVISNVTRHITRHLADRGILNKESDPLNNSIFTDTRSIIAAPVDLWPSTNSSLGIVVLLKDFWNPAEGLNLNVLACSIDARWAKSKAVISSVWGVWMPHEYYTGRVVNLVETELELQARIASLPYDPPKNETLRPIRMSTNWYDMLSPTIPDQLPADSFEMVIASAIVEGLSRCGLATNDRKIDIAYGVESETLARQLVQAGRPKEPFQKLDVSGRLRPMKVKAIFRGYVMTCEGWFDWLSNIALLIYAAIALTHAVFVIWKGQTSNAWDSVLELLVLCQRSNPPAAPILSNTSVGVESFQTVKTLVWVDFVEDGSNTSTANRVARGDLQLKVGDNLSSRDSSMKPVAGVSYGTV